MAGKQPRKKRRFVLIALAIAAVAGIVWYVATRRAPLVTLPAERPKNVLIRNVRVVDVVAGTARDAMDVVLEGDAIARIVPHPSSESGDVVIDGAGASLIPGLIDIHCHVLSQSMPPWEFELPDPAANLERLLYSGVTRAFDPATLASDIFELRQEVRDGAQIGPVLYAAGPMFTAPGGHPIPLVEKFAPWFIEGYAIDEMARQVDSEPKARAALDALLPHAPDFIKIAIDRLPLDAPRLDPNVAKALVGAAKEHGLRTVAHIGTTEDALDAGRAGAAAWLHGVYKERIPDETIAELAAFGIPMAPTLVVFETYGRMGRGDFPATPLEREVAPASVLDTRVTAPDGWTWDDAFGKLADRMGEQQASALDNVRRLARAGVVILAGSDAQGGVIHGPSLHRELALLESAGLSALEVLRAATLYNARFLANAEDPPFGVIAPGKRADLVLVRGDPLTSVAAISAIERVILGGIPIERHAVQH